MYDTYTVYIYTHIEKFQYQLASMGLANAQTQILKMIGTLD